MAKNQNQKAARASGCQRNWNCSGMLEVLESRWLLTKLDAHSPTGLADEGLSEIFLRFNEEISAESFDSADITLGAGFEGITNADLSVELVTAPGENSTFSVAFPVQNE